MNSCIAFKRLSLVALIFLGGNSIKAGEPKRIICYGDSTTWGMTTHVREDGIAYPCVLQRLLGDGYEVKNVSLPGSTAFDMLLWRGLRTLRTKPYRIDAKNEVQLDAIELPADTSEQTFAINKGNAFTFDRLSAADPVADAYPGYYDATVATTWNYGQFWPGHDGVVHGKDFGCHHAPKDGIGPCRVYYDPDDASKSIDVEIIYDSNLQATIRRCTAGTDPVSIPVGSRVVPINPTETWKGDIQIFNFGINDAESFNARLSSKGKNFLDAIKEATDRVERDGGKYLVVFPHYAGIRSGDVKAALEQRFGNRYVDLYEKFTETDDDGVYTSCKYAEEALGYADMVTAELQERAKIPMTFVAPSGKAKEYHLNAAGYAMVAHYIHEKLVELGYLDAETPGTGTPVLTSPEDGATVAMLTEKQKMAVANGGEAWAGGGNLGDNKAHPVVLSWTGTTGPAHVTVMRVKDGSTLIDETTDAGTLDAYNMILGEEYRWSVTTDSGSASRTFTVELQAPRVIMVQASNETEIAALNMRDLGGWVGKGGHRVKQGLLYRSRKLSDPYPEGYDPTAVDGRGYPIMSDAGIFVLTNRFGIRTEVDFRSQKDQARGIVRSPLGPNVEYINQGMLQPETLILQSSVGNVMLKAQMDVIFDRSKYPLDFHCKDGNSRTGGLAYYLLGLLGVDIKDAGADYMWTKYATSKAWTWDATDFTDMYANVTTNHVFTAKDGTVYDRGTNFMNVCESFTLANGYTLAQIESFRKFMLEDYEPEDPADPPVDPEDPPVEPEDPFDPPVEPQDPPEPEEPAPLGEDWGCANRVTVAGREYCVLSVTNTTVGFAWTVPRDVTAIDYLVVGGGAGGGSGKNGGGGGAGQVVSGRASVSSGMTVLATVGAGGAGATMNPRENNGANGGDSSLTVGTETVTALGGGGGGSYGANPGAKGGCGGGGGSSKALGGEGAAGRWGFMAAATFGGGGAGAGGGTADGNTRSQPGGTGVESAITGETAVYGIGGAAAYETYVETYVIPSAGQDGTGNGGGGGFAGQNGFAGGSGVVIIRYAVSGVEDPVDQPENPPVDPEDPPVAGTPILTAPAEGALIHPLTWGQQLARATDYTAPVTAAFSRNANPIRLEWTGTTGPADVTVCRSSDGHCVWKGVSETGSCDAYNYYIGEEHIWTVHTEAGTASGRFTVMQLAPRIIYTHNSEGCFSNMRDLGGYCGLDGRRVRQGLIYRSCQFDSQSQGGTGGGVPTLDAVGLFDMTNRLGIKVDLDLRNDAETGGITGSGLGPNVRWIHISGLYPKSVGGSGSPTGTMQKELAVLLDPANYPLDFHCKGGRDRTGALGFIALGLLGVSERDLYLDYVWTWDKPDPNGHIGDWDDMIVSLAKLSGDTICEKLEALVRQCGFTDADIAAYREAMLEPLADPPVHFHDTALTEHVDPTCSADGRDVYSCTNAGCTATPYAVTNALPMVAHTLSEWTTVTEPTLGQSGLRRRTCSRCQVAEELAIDALKPAAETMGTGWGLVEMQQTGDAVQVTVTFTNTTCDWSWKLPSGVTSFDFLAVAGGGSGGVARGGGGGAGGVATGKVSVPASGATLRAMVGAGGAPQTTTGDGNDGQSSYLRMNDVEVLAVYGGGGGGHFEAGRESFGRAGGNGGGAGGNGVGATVAGGAVRRPHFSAAVVQSAAFGTAGGAGATSSGAYPGGGGGGGASTAGGDGTPKSGGGAGGDGFVSLLGGTQACYAGGGGGACSKSTPGSGGAGGGGAGGDTPTAGVNGLGGGGGGSRSLRYGASGAGGSGVVIIRYTVPAEEPRTQEFDPSAGVRELDVEAADAAAALEAVGFVSPDASVVSAEDYSAYFTKSATRNTDGTWQVSVALREDEVRPVISGGDGETACFSVTDGKVTIVIGNVKPGLYYGYQTAKSLSELSSARAILSNKPARSAADVKLTVETDASASLFFRAVVSDARGQNDIL